MPSKPDLYLLTSILTESSGAKQTERTLATPGHESEIFDISTLINAGQKNCLSAAAFSEVPENILVKLGLGKVRWHLILRDALVSQANETRFRDWFHSIRQRKGGSVHTLFVQMEEENPRAALWTCGDKRYLTDEPDRIRQILVKRAPWNFEDSKLRAACDPLLLSLLATTK